MSISRKQKSRKEYKKTNRLRAQVRREINEHKITFTPQVYKKTEQEKQLLKEKKKEWKEKSNNI